MDSGHLLGKLWNTNHILAVVLGIGHSNAEPDSSGTGDQGAFRVRKQGGDKTGSGKAGGTVDPHTFLTVLCEALASVLDPDASTRWPSGTQDGAVVWGDSGASSRNIGASKVLPI